MGLCRLSLDALGLAADEPAKPDARLRIQRVEQLVEADERVRVGLIDDPAVVNLRAL